MFCIKNISESECKFIKVSIFLLRISKWNIIIVMKNGIQLNQKKDVSSMATISITTGYKFTQKSAQKLLNAMDINENKRVNKTNVNATKIKSKDEINDILKGFQDNWV